MVSFTLTIRRVTRRVGADRSQKGGICPKNKRGIEKIGRNNMVVIKTPTRFKLDKEICKATEALPGEVRDVGSGRGKEVTEMAVVTGAVLIASWRDMKAASMVAVGGEVAKGNRYARGFLVFTV